MAEKFPLHINRRVCYDFAVNVGKWITVSFPQLSHMLILTFCCRAVAYGLMNGGTAGLIWMTVFVVVGALAMVASMAEMASMFVLFLS